MDPFVALMRRYCIDYTCSHDLSVCDEIMRPDYLVHISGYDLVRDDTYKPAVERVFAHFPALALTVHELMTNGELLAMRFSEHGVAPADGGNAAAWGGIGLYRWDGERLAECFVEQDFASQEAQLASGECEPLEPPHVDPWLGTVALPRDEDAEEFVRAWLAAGDLPQAVVDVADVRVNLLFSAGDRVAFHVEQTGAYRGGIAGTSAQDVGRQTTLRCAGIARVADGGVVSVGAVSDHLGARAALGSAAVG
jgi:hypothetical protein